MTSPVEFISYEEACRLLAYDPLSGALFWRVNRGRGRGYVRQGQRADHIHQRYRRVTLRRRKMSAHRVAWLLMTGAWPRELVDHINGDGHDNR